MTNKLFDNYIATTTTLGKSDILDQLTRIISSDSLSSLSPEVADKMDRELSHLLNEYENKIIRSASKEESFKQPVETPSIGKIYPETIFELKTKAGERFLLCKIKLLPDAIVKYGGDNNLGGQGYQELGRKIEEFLAPYGYKCQRYPRTDGYADFNGGDIMLPIIADEGQEYFTEYNLVMIETLQGPTDSPYMQDCYIRVEKI